MKSEMLQKVCACALLCGMMVTSAACGEKAEDTAEIKASIESVSQEQVTETATKPGVTTAKSPATEVVTKTVKETEAMTVKVTQATTKPKPKTTTKPETTTKPKVKTTTKPKAKTTAKTTAKPQITTTATTTEAKVNTETLPEGFDSRFIDLARNALNELPYGASFCVAETSKGTVMAVMDAGGLGGDAYLITADGSKILSEYMESTIIKARYDGQYYEFFDDTSGDGSEYVCIYYPEEKYYHRDDAMRTEHAGSINARGEYSSRDQDAPCYLNNAEISKEEFDNIYVTYWKDNSSCYVCWDINVLYYLHDGTVETISLY